MKFISLLADLVSVRPEAKSKSKTLSITAQADPLGSQTIYEIVLVASSKNAVILGPIHTSIRVLYLIYQILNMNQFLYYVTRTPMVTDINPKTDRNKDAKLRGIAP